MNKADRIIDEAQATAIEHSQANGLNLTQQNIDSFCLGMFAEQIIQLRREVESLKDFIDRRR